MTPIEAMKQALEALELAMYSQVKQKSAITNLRAAIAEMEKQEPVAWMAPDGKVSTTKGVVFRTPLYPAPSVPEGEK